MNAEEMAIAIYERFLDAAYEAVECYRSEYYAIALEASLTHIDILTEFINLDDSKIETYWEDVKKEIKTLHNNSKF